MTFSPSPVSAALAGVFSAAVWPLLWSRFVVPGSGGTIEAVLITLLIIALPAHLFVVGLRPKQTAPARGVDTALLKRIGAWVGAAAIVLLAGMLIRG
jgi:hypothetical protein